MNTQSTPPEHPLLRVCREHGNLTRDLRDAAHEAFHALSVNARDWEREAVHRKLMLKFRGARLWLHEMEARAAEQIVCAHFGEPIDPIEDWVHWSIMEAIKFRLPFADYDMSLHAARHSLSSAAVQKLAQRIIVLGEAESCSLACQADSSAAGA
jgi:hypothetical protein